ncbi:MAG: hypothetical protein JWS10_85 [Cypionkella sp.]|nr:hypothetical protein [Cypionkella sp.]
MNFSQRDAIPASLRTASRRQRGRGFWWWCAATVATVGPPTLPAIWWTLWEASGLRMTHPLIARGVVRGSGSRSRCAQSIRAMWASLWCGGRVRQGSFEIGRMLCTERTVCGQFADSLRIVLKTIRTVQPVESDGKSRISGRCADRRMVLRNSQRGGGAHTHTIAPKAFRK